MLALTCHQQQLGHAAQLHAGSHVRARRARVLHRLGAPAAAACCCALLQGCDRAAGGGLKSTQRGLQLAAGCCKHCCLTLHVSVIITRCISILLLRWCRSRQVSRPERRHLAGNVRQAPAEAHELRHHHAVQEAPIRHRQPLLLLLLLLVRAAAAAACCCCQRG